MKILLATLNFHSLVGKPLYFYELARAMQDRGHEITILGSTGGLITKKALEAKIEVQEFSQITHAFKRRNYDVIIASDTLIINTILQNQLFANVPLIQILHSEIIHNEVPIMHERIRQYIAVRETIQKVLVKKYKIPSHQVTVIYNPIDNSRFNMQGVQDNEYILFCGALNFGSRQLALEKCIEYGQQNHIEVVHVGLPASAQWMKDHQSLFHHYDPIWEVEGWVKNCTMTAGIMLGRSTIEGYMCGKPGLIFDVCTESGSVKGHTIQTDKEVAKYDSRMVALAIEQVINMHVIAV